jgi:triosephosphate isomerase
MNKTLLETSQFLVEFIPEVKDISGVDIVIAPPFTAIGIAAAVLRGTNIFLAAQDVFMRKRGVYREISLNADLGRVCRVGHRKKTVFSETDDIVNRKSRPLRKQGWGLLIGESLEEREERHSTSEQGDWKRADGFLGGSRAHMYDWDGQDGNATAAQEAHSCKSETEHFMKSVR